MYFLIAVYQNMFYNVTVTNYCLLLIIVSDNSILVSFRMVLINKIYSLYIILSVLFLCACSTYPTGIHCALYFFLWLLVTTAVVVEMSEIYKNNAIFIAWNKNYITETVGYKSVLFPHSVVSRSLFLCFPKLCWAS